MPGVTHAVSRPIGKARDGTSADAEDLDLVDDLQRGCPLAFERMVRLHAGRMLAVAKRILGDETEAHDALQDAFLAAFKALPGFHRSARLSTWLHRIAVNAALMRLRSRRRRPERSIEELLPSYLPDGHRVDPLEAWSEERESALDAAERNALVHRSIDALPDDFRTVIVLRDLEGLDTDETARLLGISSGAVKTRLHRARQALRTLLERELLR